MLDGKLTPGPDGGAIVSFVRRIDRPVEKVWAALTVPERVADWLGAAEIELKSGGRYELRFDGGHDVMTGVITLLEPPRLLELAWRENGGPQSTLTWRLEPDGDGCRLSLTQVLSAEVKDIPGFVSGWHLHLDALPGACDGVKIPWDQSRWLALDGQYRAQAEA